MHRNFTQVFGRNYWVWIFPWYGASGKPNGDGIIWPVAEYQLSESDVNIESEARKENPSVPINSFTKPEAWPDERRSDIKSRNDGKSISESETDISMIKVQKSPVKN